MHFCTACLLLYVDYVWVSLGNTMKAKQSKACTISCQCQSFYDYIRHKLPVVRARALQTEGTSAKAAEYSVLLKGLPKDVTKEELVKVSNCLYHDAQADLTEPLW